nr:MAG TPA: hypothetical protein [Herelleviridae sp.]
MFRLLLRKCLGHKEGESPPSLPVFILRTVELSPTIFKIFEYFCSQRKF